MHADELRTAVAKIVQILDKSDIRSVIDQYRSAIGDQRTAAAARLGHAGAVIMERLDSLSESERQVAKFLHLDSLGSAQYWQQLLSSVDNPKEHQAEIVRLASRVMFAGNHLPGIVGLLDTVKAAPDSASNVVPLPVLEKGEGRLFIRLTDAGERASDPDRIARSIDGVDMLYSACASIARKPAIDLRLDGVTARANRDRDLQFTGERDSMAAVYAVIDSIPAALADIDPEQDIDLDGVVRSLPIFEDLNTLASLGTFSKKDLKDISDTMHQGALLTLESGVILVDSESNANSALASSANDAHVSQAEARSKARIAASAPGVDVKGLGVDESDSDSSEGTGMERDEHYDRYLREREAMLQPESAGQVNGYGPDLSVGEELLPRGGARSAKSDDQSRREAVDELLKSLGQSRSS